MITQLIESFKDTPEMINSLNEMSEPNIPITVHKGPFKIGGEGKEITIDGEIKFSWFPSKRVKFSGIGSGDFNDLFELFTRETPPKLYIKDCEVGDCTILDIGSTIEGVSKKSPVIGDKSISVSKIKFSIPNFLDIHGSVVKKTTPENLHVSNSRIILENDDYIFIIDKAYNYDEIRKKLKHSGGFIIQYGGELTKKKENLVLEDAKEILSCLSKFLTFLNGRRTSALFRHGVHDDEIFWSDFTPYYVDPFKEVIHWLPSHSTKEVNDIWKRFSNLWKDNDAKDFLTSAIHWYVEVNNNSGFVIGSIVTAQIALELIYNWLIVENKKLLIGKDSENISAANKIRLLVSYIGINYETPSYFKGLQGYIKNNREIIDAPDAIVRIRNYVVHSQADKRKNLSSISNEVLYEALQLSIWYLELSLLFILEYKGKYHNRCSRVRYSGETELVPWVLNPM